MAITDTKKIILVNNTVSNPNVAFFMKKDNSEDAMVKIVKR
jgi:hypothetical protein